MMKRYVLFAAFLCLPLLCSRAVSQAAPAVAYSPQELLQIAQQMRDQAKASQTPGTGILEKRLDASTLLAFRDRDGKAELHEQSEDVFVVLQGSGTLVSGGTIASPTTTAPGEIRGVSVLQGTSRKLGQGDIAHVPANVPHQWLTGPGGSVTYFVVKVPLK